MSTIDPEYPSLSKIREKSVILPHVNKILVANRGEIPIRIFRSAHELGMHTVAVYSYEDRLSMHRFKADEAYQIGKKGQYSPVQAYLQMDEIIKIALEHGVQMIHPGYGFLSENAQMAAKVAEAGLIWVGPEAKVIDDLGDKVSARILAAKCNVPTVPGTPGPLETAEQAKEFVAQYGYPVIIKAAFGGGGRGMRVVNEGDDITDAFARASSEAKAAFGNGTCFVERFLHHPKHIEVQLLADNYGNTIHLFERDCSVQRRHQKVVEMAPSKTLTPKVRDAILADAVKLAKTANYRNAGTAEFLVDNKGNHYFIEVNPRIQVEHTITEEITGVDIVAAQIEIAAGASLEKLGLLQDKITTRGFAIQCRITTEDPAKNFQPDTGKIDVYRSAGGNGIRLDGGNGFAGSVISPHYDSLLVKCTAHASNFEVTRRKMVRALIEFRIRGVKTNMPFLLALLTHPTFKSGDCWTTFIDDTPSLFDMVSSRNRAQKLLTYLGDLIVNGSSVAGQSGEPKLHTEAKIPEIHDKDGDVVDVSTPPPSGWRKVLLEEGADKFAQKVRAHSGSLIMDTTWRDAHQSLMATRVRTIDLLNIAPTTAHAFSGAFALECWGGATFDVAMRFLHEDPWDRLRKMRAAVPNIPFQMLLRGANGVAYSSLPDNAIDHFVRQAKENGVDIFRVFDSLNDLSNLKVGVDAVKKAGGVVEATVCYSGDMLRPGKKYNLAYYMEMVAQIVEMGTHFLGIKDMAGTMKPAAAKLLISSIRDKYPSLPIHLHTHDSAGTGVSTYVSAAAAGVDIVDCAVNSMSGLTSQPSLSAFIAATDGSFDTGIPESAAREVDAYWAEMRLLYSCFGADLKGPDPEVYQTEIPGGQLTNLIFQAQQVGLGAQWAETKKAYIKANSLLGDIVKVTPTSKVVGDLAQFMVSNKLEPEDVERLAGELDFPDSVLDFFEGKMGTPYGGFPEPLRTNVLRGKRTKMEKRPGLYLKPFDLQRVRNDLRARFGHDITECDVASYNMYPRVYEDFKAVQEKYDDLSVLPTRFFLSAPKIGEEVSVHIEQGKTLIVKVDAIGALDEQTGTRVVYFQLNGELRKVTVDDKTASVEKVSKPKAEVHNPCHVGAPMSGVIVEVRTHVGADVKKGEPLCVLSAMKMEMVVSSPADGRVAEVLVQKDENVEGGDLVVRLEEK